MEVAGDECEIVGGGSGCRRGMLRRVPSVGMRMNVCYENDEDGGRGGGVYGCTGVWVCCVDLL
jgi:hypothetical protein